MAFSSVLWRGVSSIASSSSCLLRPSLAASASSPLTASVAPIYRAAPTSWLGGMLGGMRFKHAFKTNRSAYKRFRVRGNGSLKRNKAGKSHNTGHKGRKQVTQLSQSTGVIEKKIEQRMRLLIGAKA